MPTSATIVKPTLFIFKMITPTTFVNVYATYVRMYISVLGTYTYVLYCMLVQTNELLTVTNFQKIHVYLLRRG
jgi:hypothetical protein